MPVLSWTEIILMLLLSCAHFALMMRELDKGHERTWYAFSGPFFLGIAILGIVLQFFYPLYMFR